MTTTHKRASWRLLRLGGIDLRIHPTFLVLVALALAGAFGSVSGGLVWLGIVFGSVILHELAHCAVARRRGIEVLDITLLPIGGVSRIEQLPEHPRDELAIAAAGPATSLAIAAVGATAAAAAGTRLLPVDLAAAGPLARLVWANLLLGGFNLLPAFPLDGGRVLRAHLAARLGVVKATQLAGRVGRAAAWLMGLVGLVWDPWLVLIAVYLYVGGRVEEAATVVHLQLEGHRVGEAMLPMEGLWVHPALTPVDIDIDLDLEAAVEALRSTGAPAAAVRDAEGHAVGLLRLRDVEEFLAREAAKGPSPSSPPAGRSR